MSRAIPTAIAALAVLAGTLASPPSGRAACAAAVVVDGRMLIGTETRPGARLPAAAGTYPAISPACNDTNFSDEQDRPTRVRRLTGVPPRIAVAERAGDTLYLAAGTLPALATHPLHLALFRNRREPSYRQQRRCGPYRTAVRGRVVEDGALRIRTASRTIFVSVDAATRITNRPAYQRVLRGQRLVLRTSRCGPRRVADRITFAGPSPTP